MDKITHAGVMAKLGAAYGRTIEADVLAVWYESLSRFANEDVEQAVGEWIANCDEFPKGPNKIIEAVQAVLRRKAGQRADTHGLPEQSEQPQLDGTTLKTQRLAGLQQARDALAAARAQNPEPETGDDE